MLHPEGFVVPPLPYLVVLVGFGSVIAALLLAFRPPVTKWTVVSFAPWMVTGAALRVLDEIEAFPELLAPLFGAPAVYVSTFVLAGGVWIVAILLVEGGLLESTVRLLGAAGTGLAIASCTFVIWQGYLLGTLAPFWPVIGLVVSGVVAAIALALFSIRYTEAMAVTGKVGMLVVFSHVLDGVSTAIGIDALGAHEQTPLPRMIMDFAATLPTADALGEGWLFVLVKVVLACVIVLFVADYAREAPSRGNLLLGVIAAVGLGPGVHNLLLFLVSG